MLRGLCVVMIMPVAAEVPLVGTATAIVLRVSRRLPGGVGGYSRGRGARRCLALCRAGIGGGRNILFAIIADPRISDCDFHYGRANMGLRLQGSTPILKIVCQNFNAPLR
jgi:hypothetical protein